MPRVDKKPVSRGNGERILFVDDETQLVDIASQVLEKLGYQVTAFTSSLEALDAFQNNPNGFDLVATDYTMPKMMGTQLAGKIKQIRPDVPVLLITGFSDRVKKDNIHEFHVDEHLLKPWDYEELSTTIRKLLDGSAAK